MKIIVLFSILLIFFLLAISAKNFILIHSQISDEDKYRQDYYLAKADALYQQGAYQEALDSYINFIKLSPSSSSNTILVDKGKDLLNQQKEVEKSVKYLNTALDFNPQNGEAYYVRGNALYQQGDYEGALDSYNTALDFNPQNGEAHHGRG